MRVRFALAGFAVLLALAVGTNARTHGTGTHTGFVATVSTIDPPQVGLLVSVAGGHERLVVRNLTKKTVVVFAQSGLPVLRLGPGEGGTFADSRIGSTGPPPEEGEFVRNWAIRGAANGRPFTIRGFLGYRPPPGTVHGQDSVPRWAVAVAAAVGVAALAALALTLRRRQGESESERQATER